MLHSAMSRQLDDYRMQTIEAALGNSSLLQTMLGERFNQKCIIQISHTNTKMPEGFATVFLAIQVFWDVMLFK